MEALLYQKLNPRAANAVVAYIKKSIPSKSTANLFSFKSPIISNPNPLILLSSSSIKHTITHPQYFQQGKMLGSRECFHALITNFVISFLTKYLHNWSYFSLGCSLFSSFFTPTPVILLSPTLHIVYPGRVITDWAVSYHPQIKPQSHQ